MEIWYSLSRFQIYKIHKKAKIIHVSLFKKNIRSPPLTFYFAKKPLQMHSIIKIDQS